MFIRHRSLLVLASVVLAISSLLTACGTTTTTSSSGTKTAAVKNVSIDLSYQPDIQFAPFYVAQSKGYYQAAGLNVNIVHNDVTTAFAALEADKATFAFAGGDELLSARDKHKDFQAVDVATIFQKYPVSLIVPADSPIKTLADLKGHTIGDPLGVGSTYLGLLALLASAHLTTADVHVQVIGFNQVSALTQHRVDAVTGYSNSQPLEIEQTGMNVRTFDVSDYLPLVSNGIITTQQTLQSQPQMVRAFVQATLKGLRDVISDPDKAVQISQSYIPGVNTTQALAILKASIPIFKGDGHLGYNDSKAWSTTAQFLAQQKQIAPVSNVQQVYTNQAVS